ncbi:MAG: hypothetical protein U5R31_08255 [Acidimicrobiia bacterium]|nr:hypothetical protein [Acidimicrobiia bacterium]
MGIEGHPALRESSAVDLARLAERVQPVALAHERTLSVLPALESLLPDGLRRGSVVAVTGTAATSLALAVTAGPSGAGSWSVAVGVPALGLVAAGELGVALERLAVVGPPPPDAWAPVVATLVEAFDVVLVRPPRTVRRADARRLTARARERGTVVLQLGATDALEGDLHLHTEMREWCGLGDGHGHLRARRVRVHAEGRRRATRPRRVDLWLADGQGRVSLAGDRDAVPGPRTVDGGRDDRVDGAGRAGYVTSVA